MSCSISPAEAFALPLNRAPGLGGGAGGGGGLHSQTKSAEPVVRQSESLASVDAPGVDTEVRAAKSRVGQQDEG